jgi:formate-dependent nitrite reductase cytochrome c552 subunit
MECESGAVVVIVSGTGDLRAFDGAVWAPGLAEAIALWVGTICHGQARRLM